jgi:hypothetical protein
MPLLGVAGRVGSVTSTSKHPAAAFQLLIALSGPEWSSQVCAASPATTLFRGAHLKSPREWVEREASAPAAGQYAQLTQQVLSGQDAVGALKLPGRAEYLQALDQAVHQALRGEVTPAEALSQCAGAWSEITDRLGLEQQREAYRQSVVQQP